MASPEFSPTLPESEKVNTAQGLISESKVALETKDISVASKAFVNAEQWIGAVADDNLKAALAAQLEKLRPELLTLAEEQGYILEPFGETEESQERWISILRSIFRNLSEEIVSKLTSPSISREDYNRIQVKLSVLNQQLSIAQISDAVTDLSLQKIEKLEAQIDRAKGNVDKLESKIAKVDVVTLPSTQVVAAVETDKTDETLAKFPQLKKLQEKTQTIITVSDELETFLIGGGKTITQASIDEQRSILEYYELQFREIYKLVDAVEKKILPLLLTIDTFAAHEKTSNLLEEAKEILTKLEEQQAKLTEEENKLLNEKLEAIPEVVKLLDQLESFEAELASGIDASRATEVQLLIPPLEIAARDAIINGANPIPTERIFNTTIRVRIQKIGEDLANAINTENVRRDGLKVTEQNFNFATAWRDFAVLQGWIGEEVTKEQLGSEELIKLVETKLIETIILFAAKDYWFKPTNKENGHVNILQWPLVSRDLKNVTTNDIVEKHPDSDRKEEFKEQIAVLSELLSGASEWGKIAVGVSFEGLKTFFEKYSLPGDKLKTIGEMSSSEEIDTAPESKEALSTGMLIYEGMYLYANWMESYVFVTEEEKKELTAKVEADIAKGIILLPTKKEIEDLVVDKTGKSGIPTLDEAIQSRRTLAVYWKQLKYSNVDIKYQEFRKVLRNHIINSRIKSIHNARNKEYGIWPIEHIDEKQRNQKREEVAFALGMRVLSKNRLQYVLNNGKNGSDSAGNDIRGKTIDPINGKIYSWREVSTLINLENILKENPLKAGESLNSEEGVRRVIRRLALEKGKGLELFAYTSAIVMGEPILHDTTGTQSNSAYKVMSTSDYRGRKESTGREGAYIASQFQFRRLHLPAMTYLSVKLPKDRLGRLGGSQLRKALGRPDLMKHALHHGGFDLIGVSESGQWNRWIDAFQYTEKIYGGISAGFTAVGIDIKKISDVKEQSIFSGGTELTFLDEVVAKINNYVDKDIGYWIDRFIRTHTEDENDDLIKGYDSRIWTVDEDKKYKALSPHLKHMFNFTEQKLVKIRERAKKVGLKKAISIEIIKMILIETLMRQGIKEMKNDDVAGIVYVFTGENLSGYNLQARDDAGNISELIGFTMEDVAYCFQEAEVNVKHPAIQVFQRAGGII